jgi:rfaE bifunctional protein kinase chain/domain
MTETGLQDLFGRFKGKKIAVVGDLMIDRYYWGAVHRVSPEAPVPIVEVESESTRLGGAANVANNILALGGDPVLVGLIGNDYAGNLFTSMLKDLGLETRGLIVDASRPTTIKTRVIAHNQHVVRIDNESKVDSPEHLRPMLVDAVKYNIRSLDAIILEDYNKGTITTDVIEELIAVARKYNKIVTVDPKFNNFFEYRHVTVFKPNRREVEEVLGGKLRSQDDVDRVGRKLLADLSAENVLLTRGEEGMSLFEANGGVMHIPTTADHVLDVSGAGDTVIATLTLALAGGAGVRDACTLANCAGGVVVGSVGIVPIVPEELLAAAVRCAQVSGQPA